MAVDLRARAPPALQRPQAPAVRELAAGEQCGGERVDRERSVHREDRDCRCERADEPREGRVEQRREAAAGGEADDVAAQRSRGEREQKPQHLCGGCSAQNSDAQMYRAKNSVAYLGAR